jgi:flagellar motor switch/type III secretory pathway protein FliN
VPDPENQLAVHAPAGEPANALVRAETPAGNEAGTSAEAEARDMRLDRLPMELHVMVKVERMRVEDLLALERGTVLTTVHEHSQDVPVRCGGALLLWGEFEVVEQTLAVRVTRLA